MRQLKDMSPSMLSSALGHAGLLLIVFGVASAYSSQNMTMMWVALIGGVSLASAIVIRKPSQKVAYRQYLKGYDEADLVEAKTKKWMDEESMEVIDEELAQRKA